MNLHQTRSICQLLKPHILIVWMIVVIPIMELTGVLAKLKPFWYIMMVFLW